MNDLKINSAADKVLFYIKTKGPQTAAQLAERLDVTPMAVRQHLYQMRNEGLAKVKEKKQKVGRPAQFWYLTDKAALRFPDNHSELALAMLDAVRDAYGEEGVERIIESRTEKMKKSYASKIPGSEKSLKQRVKALAKLRDDEGYMTDIVDVKDGGVLFVENNCPICAAAKSCTGICSGELELFREVLGDDVEVERSEHLLSDGLRCAYQITQKSESKSEA